MNRQSFIFGKPVEGEFFTDREKETTRLSENFKAVSGLVYCIALTISVL